MIQNLDPNDFFKTIASVSQSEIKIKGSRFLGFAFPISDKIQAEEILEIHRKDYYDATHNCFAYTVGCQNEIFRYSDDGEPNGTAGKPIYQAIKHFDYCNVLVIVTRYFGGTKLGVGPLARAYYDAAYQVLSSVPSKIEYFTRKLEIVVDYSMVSTIKRLLEPISVETNETYTDVVTFTSKILKSKYDSVIKEIIQISQGKAKINQIAE